MQINLFRCNAERNRVIKTNYISNRFVLDGTLRSSSSVTNPVIVIEKESNPIDYDYNYMYISSFGRYYFIDDIVSVNNKLWEIHASVDVLYSFADEILSNSAIIEKSENNANANLYLDDGSFVMDSRLFNTLIEFPGGFNNNGSNILICAGGT